MAIIDNLQKISDTIWELPASYKQGMRVPARVIATEKLVREMDEAVYQQISVLAADIAARRKLVSNC
jgi:tRNA-splicing ligase RtcB (3'-phosphate/5'-hydroxy nucleic acid ligase)